MAAPTPPASGNASLTDILTAVKNVVTALNNATQTYLNVNGLTVVSAINVPTVIKASGGRVVNVSITTAGASTGVIYDAVLVGATTKPLWVIPEAIATDGEPYRVNLPSVYGIVVVPGGGQVVAVSYS
jgi:hypothetical protein